MRDHKKYDVWIKGHELTLFVYKFVLPELPGSEQYDLGSQIKRASYSIPLSIVEGCGRNTIKDFTHFLDIALGSAPRKLNIIFSFKRLGVYFRKNV